jgi:hypothetical protein
LVYRFLTAFRRAKMSFACKMPDSAATDGDLKCILSNAKTVAIVGISSQEDKPSHKVAKYLFEHGFTIFAVNPKCDEVLGLKCYPDLKSVPGHVDVVDVFRKPEDIAAVAEQAVEIGAGVLWMQLGLEHEGAAQTARSAGLNVVMNRCMKMEHCRYFGKEEDSAECATDNEQSAEGLKSRAADFHD